MQNTNYLKKELYELIKTDESIFDFIQESSLDGLWYWDLEQPEEEWMNPKFWTILGYDYREMPHKASAWQDIIHPEDLKLATDNFIKHCENPAHPYDQQVRYTHKNGSTVWIRCRGLAIRDEEGKPVRMLGAHQDITELKNKELLLQKNRDLLSKTQHISKVGGWTLDLKTNEVVWTEEIYKMYGWDPTLPAPSYPDQVKLYTPESWEALKSAVSLASEQGIPYELELTIIRNDGSHVWMWARGEAEFDENKNIICLTGVAQDITERKILELEREDLTKRLHYALDASGDGIWDWTLKDDKTVYSKAWIKMLGYEVGEISSLATEWSDRLHPDDAEWVLEAMNKITQTPDNGDTFNQKYRFRNKEGDYLWMLNKAKVVERNEKGEASRVVGTHTNITEQKRKEAEIAAISKEIKDITNAVNESSALSITSAEGIFLKVNKQLCELTGYKEEELIGQKHSILHSDYHDAEFWRSQKETIMAGKTWKGEIRKQKKDGSDYWVNCVIQPIVNEAGEVERYISIRQDITDRKKAELDLKESEKKFRELFEHLIDEVHLWKIIKNKSGKIRGWELVDANPAALKSWGKSIKEVIGKTANEIFGADAHDQFMPIVEEIFKTYTPHRWENHFAVTGQYLQMESIPFGDYFISTGKDITAAKKENQHLKLLESVITNTKDSVMITEAEPFDEPGPKIIYVNEAFTKMTGYTAEEVIGKTPRILQGPNSDKEALARLSKAIRKWEPYEITTINYKKSGDEFWVNFAVTPVADEKGWYTHWIAIERDVTKQIESEQALKDSKLRLSLATQAGGIGVWDWDVVTNKMTLDDQIFALYGVKRNEFTEELDVWFNGVHEADRERSIKEVKSAIKGEKEYNTAFRIQHPNGEIKNIRALGTVIRDPQGKAIRMVGTNWDITQEKEALGQIKEAKEEAEAASKAKSEFLANMSHEIRTPLNGVIGFTDLLAKTPLNPAQQQYADSANVSGHALLGIINDILDFSKIEAGMLELEVKKADMVAILENSIDIVKFSAANKEIELLLDIDPSMPRFAHIDAIRTKQILANLLSNAVKFTKKGEVALKVVYKALEGQQGKLSISVRDTGVGITEEQKAKLFKSFSQADSSTTRKFGGTGLGLVISQMIAEKMGSKITIDSTPDVSTTFSFEIITDFEEGERPDVRQITGLERCLIIDDNHNNQLILKQMLKQWKIKSDSCNNGLEALNKLQNSEPYDVIICDYDMPYLNGIDTIGLMKDKLNLSAEKQGIILLHSSLENADLNQKSKELGIRFRLNKPVKSQALFTYLSLLNHKTESAPQKENAETVKVGQTNEKIKVLIAEDNPMNMMLSKIMLAQLMPNSEVYEAENGLEAFEQYKSISPDLIFMDVQMPELDGIEATQKIRALEGKKKGRHIPIIALTAGALKEEKEKCFTAGMDDFLTKPLEPAKIQSVLSKFFQQEKIGNDEVQRTESKNEMHFGFSELTRSIENDKEMVQELVTILLADIPNKIDQLEQACSEIDLANIKKISHSIKGSALHMRCGILADIAGKMENATQDNSFTDFEVLLTELKEEWEIVKNLMLKKI
jgi:PAS domain S-box-containing protein